MAQSIPKDFLDLFRKKAYGHLATLMPDGSPQVTPVWCDYDDPHVLVNSASGRRKDKNMRERPQVALSIKDPENAYRYLEIRGRIVEATEKGADDHIDRMAKKYLDLDQYPNRQPGEVRVLYKIEPQRFTSMGG